MGAFPPATPVGMRLLPTSAMKRLVPIALLLLAIVLGVAAKRGESPSIVPGAIAAAAKPPAMLRTSTGDGDKRPARHGDAATSAEQRETVIQQIDEAVSTYRPEAVKTIGALLNDPDPGIRSAARDGLIQLGEPDGIQALRVAAAHLSDPAEARACREAADYLGLPSWSETAEAQETVADLQRERQPAGSSP